MGPWFCDTCDEEIADARDGYVIWRDSDDGPHGFRIIHQGRCDDRRSPNSMPLDSYVDLEGLTHLLTFLTVGPLKLQGDLSGNSRRLASNDEFADFVRRVQIPGYEQARRRFAARELGEKLSDANEWYPYTVENIARIVSGEL